MHRNSTTRAQSSGSPNRCSAISPSNRSRDSGDPRPLAMAREERIQPGAMAFTVTLYGPSSDASLRV